MTWLTGSASRADQYVNTLRLRWLTLAGNQIALPVPATSTTLIVAFLNKEATLKYGVIAVPNWNTTVWVTAKGAGGCTLNFGSAAPANAAVDLATFRSD